MPQRQLAHFAGADEENRLIVEAVKNLTDIVNSGTGHGDAPLGDAGFATHALGHDVGVLKEPVQDRSRGAALIRGCVSAPHLAGDLSLADDHAIQAGHDTE